MTVATNAPMKPLDDISLSQFSGTWWVAHTKPRQEKALALDLYRAERQYFAPAYEVTRRSKGREWRSTLPLFPGYVFVCGSESDRLFALQTNRIANMIDVPDQARIVRELSAIDQLLVSGLAVCSVPTMKKGSICRICSGPMAGLEGQIERRKGKTHFVVNVSILGQCAMVEIEADNLEPVA